MTVVVDASLVVSGLVDSGAVGTWAEDLLATEALAAPHLMMVEVANVLRRSARLGSISDDTAALAHGDLLGLRVELFPYAPFADRAWALRDNLTLYDAHYVAMAESLDAPLATVDGRLGRAPGPRCRFLDPPAR